MRTERTIRKAAIRMSLRKELLLISAVRKASPSYIPMRKDQIAYWKEYASSPPFAPLAVSHTFSLAMRSLPLLVSFTSSGLTRIPSFSIPSYYTKVARKEIKPKPSKDHPKEMMVCTSGPHFVSFCICSFAFNFHHPLHAYPLLVSGKEPQCFGVQC